MTGDFKQDALADWEARVAAVWKTVDTLRSQELVQTIDALASERPAALSRDELVDAVTDNLRNLRLDALDVVNLRIGTPQGPQQASIAEPFEVLAGLQKKGLIRHLGLSNATPEQVAECQAIAAVVCVQNRYNIACRQDDALVDSLARQGIAYVPYDPLGGINPIQSSTLSALAQTLDATPMQLALAWLLHRSPNILPIPGTSSTVHLSENMAACRLKLTDTMMVELDRLGSVEAPATN